MSIDVHLAENGDYWRAWWKDPSGRRRFKGLGAKAEVSKAEALRKCRELAARFIVTPAASGQSKAPQLGAWLKLYMEQRTDLAEASRVNHSLTCRALEDHFGASTRLDKITRAAAAAFSASISTRKNGEQTIAPATARKYVALARQIFERARRQDLVAFNPFDRERVASLSGETAWQYVSDDDTLRVLDACPDSRWRLLFALCRWAGLRVGEARRVRWEDIDWQRHSLAVRLEEGEERTTKRAARTTPIEPRLYAMLREAFEAAPCGAGLVAPIGSNNLLRTAGKIIRRAGLEEWGKPFHTLRKSLVTDWQAKYPPLDVAAWLGHSVVVAARHYHQTRAESFAAVTESRSDRMNSPNG